MSFLDQYCVLKLNRNSLQPVMQVIKVFKNSFTQLFPSRSSGPRIN